MKIALITEYFPKSEKAEISGGVEARAFYVGKYLAEGNDVTVYTTLEKGVGGEDIIFGMKVRRIKPSVEYSQSSSLLARLQFIRNAAKEVKHTDFDIADGYNFISYPVAWNSRAKKKVATYHDVWIGEWIKNIGLKGAFGEILERYTLGRAWDRYIAVSEYTKGKLLKAGISPEKIAVVHNGVEYDRIEQIKSRKYDKPTVCAVSRLVNYKRIDELLAAMKLVEGKILDAQLKIVGSGPEERNLKDLSEKLGLKEKVEFLGYVRDHDEVLRTINSSHAFCLPSTVEGFGISIIEAMALKIPYVASDIPAIIEATHSGAGGLLHTPGDAQDLAAKLIQVLEGKVQANADFIQKEYDWKKLAEKVEEVYKEV